MKLVTVAASPAELSRSIFLLKRLETRFEEAGLQVQGWSLDDFDPAALVYTRFDDAAIQRYQRAIREADAVVFATPVYQAAYSGGLKLLLDVIPEQGLKDKAVLSLATGGSNAHLLVLDYVLKPVLASLGARVQLPGVYVSAQDLLKDETGHFRLNDALAQRLDAAASELLTLLAADEATPAHENHPQASHSGAPELIYL